MNLLFKPLCSLAIQHEYYGNKPCPDFDFLFAQHSQLDMAGHSIRLRRQNHQLKLYFQTSPQDRGKPPLHKLDGLELLIGLKLKNPYFNTFTTNLPNGMAFYQNISNPLQLSENHHCLLAGERFKPVVAIARPMVTTIQHLTGNTAENPPCWQQTLHTAEDKLDLDISHWQPGCYLFTNDSIEGSDSQILIIAPWLAHQSLFGIIRLVFTPDIWQAAKPPNSTYTFTA